MPDPIPAPPIPEGETIPLEDCDPGPALGYPFGYGSDVCLAVDPCVGPDGWLYADYEQDVHPSADQGTTLFTAMPCTPPLSSIDDGATVTVVAERGSQSTLPETGATTDVALVMAVALVLVGVCLRGLTRVA